MSSSFAAGIPAWAQCSMLLLNPNVFPLLQEFQHGLNAFAQPLCLPFAAGIPALAPCFAQPLCLSFAAGIPAWAHCHCSTIMSFLCCRNFSMNSMNSLLLFNPNVFPLLQEFQHGVNAFAQPLCLSFAAGIPAWGQCFCSTLMSFLC